MILCLWVGLAHTRPQRRHRRRAAPPPRPASWHCLQSAEDGRSDSAVVWPCSSRYTQEERAQLAEEGPNLLLQRYTLVNYASQFRKIQVGVWWGWLGGGGGARQLSCLPVAAAPPGPGCQPRGANRTVAAPKPPWPHPSHTRQMCALAFADVHGSERLRSGEVRES